MKLSCEEGITPKGSDFLIAVIDFSMYSWGALFLIIFVFVILPCLFIVTLIEIENE